MCQTYTLLLGSSDKLSSFITQAGCWWGTIPVQKKSFQPVDIDVVGVAPMKKKVVVGECKFRNEKLDRTVFETLVERAAYLPGKPEIAEYILFSLDGFSDWFT